MNFVIIISYPVIIPKLFTTVNENVSNKDIININSNLTEN